MIHFVGVGGVGMSAIATVLAAQGESVSGCDRADGPMLDRLRATGIACAAPHDPAHLAGVDELVVSGAIAADEPEIAQAKSLGIPIRHRADALARVLAAHRHKVVITGAHGKTTTTAMVAWTLVATGRDPTFLVGGDIPQLGVNAAAGAGGICVAEGDESDRSVVRLPADVGCVLNVDHDHLDHYASVDEVIALLARWTRLLPADGLLVAGDGVELPTSAPVSRFGVGPGEGLRALELESIAGGVAFRPSRGPARVELRVPGRHNAANACAAAAILEGLGVTLDDTFAALADFRGAQRRFEFVGDHGGAAVYDDYAHHPTELAATVEAALGLGAERLVLVFQPHMPWRADAFADEFARALGAADVVVVLETYVARGGQAAGDGARRLVRLLADDGRDVSYAPTYADGLAALRERTRPGDAVLCIGAGPVDRIARAFVEGTDP